MVFATLADKYKEAPVFGGIARDGTWRVSVYANPVTGTFTLVLVTADGTACLGLVGENGQSITFVAPKVGL
jgi:altronate dehydratase